MVDQETCTVCEGSGAIWADGKAHYPYYRGETVACTCCGGKGWWAIDNPTAMSDLLAVCEVAAQYALHTPELDFFNKAIAKAKGES